MIEEARGVGVEVVSVVAFAMEAQEGEEVMEVVVEGTVEVESMVAMAAAAEGSIGEAHEGVEAGTEAGTGHAPTLPAAT